MEVKPGVSISADLDFRSVRIKGSKVKIPDTKTKVSYPDTPFITDRTRCTEVLYHREVETSVSQKTLQSVDTEIIVKTNICLVTNYLQISGVGQTCKTTVGVTLKPDVYA